MNLRGALAILKNELARFFRTVFGSILSPVLTTSLYIVVFGAAIGSRMDPAQFGGASSVKRASVRPSWAMIAAVSSTSSSLPLLITPTRSAISWASSI